MKSNKLVYCLAALACVCLAGCENPIMKTWWVEKEEQPAGKTPDIEYVPIMKMIPQVTYETVYETIIEYQPVHDTVFVQLPPEVIYETIIQQVTKEVPVYIYETVIEKVPEYVYETIIKTEIIHETVIEKVYEYVYETVTEIQYETVYVPVYVTVIEKVPEYIYEVITEIQYETVYETVHDTVEVFVERDPTEDEIKEYIKNHPEEIIEIIKNDPGCMEIIKEIVKEYIENNQEEIIEIIKNDPDFEEIIKEYIRNHIHEVIQIIKESPDYKEIIREIIESIPPEEIINYLTEEQIEYIIKQQPPQLILQTITIIDIEYIIFAGNAVIYNGPHAAGANTDLTTQEKNSNDATVSSMAGALKLHDEYLIMLHGHANPTDFSEGETGELMQLSLGRAEAVEEELKSKFKALNGGVDIDDARISVSGYGGEKVLFSSNSIYTPLNRRVEMILVRVGVEE